MGFIIMALAVVCAFIQSNVGFGFNIMFMSMGPFFMDYSAAQAICFSGTIVGNAANFLPRYKKINIKQVIIPAFSYCIATYVSIELTMGLETAVLRRMLGIVLVLLALYFVFFSGKIHIRPTTRNGVLAGIVSGIGGGMFAINGPPMAVYYLSAMEDKEEYMATIQAYFFVTSIATLVIKLATGTFGAFSVIWLLFLAAGIIIGAFVGKKTYSMLKPDVVRLCVYAFMAISGLWIFING
ncbi:MAG: sulfite exporter TauE/SafE family protein [Lachnospiraceae bacterium]|nr:sulfite exporter TauE/SafE family protein [Lachnospiraceae bacterium]